MKKVFLTLFLALAVSFSFNAQQTGGGMYIGEDIGDQYLDCHYVPAHDIEVPVFIYVPLIGMVNTGFTSTVTVPGSYQGSECSDIGL